jgi:hypothetical protein
VSDEREVPSTASTMLVEVMISSRSRAGGEDSERGFSHSLCLTNHAGWGRRQL